MVPAEAAFLHKTTARRHLLARLIVGGAPQVNAAYIEMPKRISTSSTL